MAYSSLGSCLVSPVSIDSPDCVRSVVYHLFAYCEGLALGVSAWTASYTTVISLSVCCCTVPPIGILYRELAILALISVHGAFLKSNLASTTRSGVATSDVVSIAL